MSSVISRIDGSFPPAETVRSYERYFGPQTRASAALSEDGRVALRRDLEALWTRHNRASDDTT